MRLYSLLCYSLRLSLSVHHLFLGCTNPFLSFLSPAHLFFPLYPRVTPFPNSSMQNRAGRSSLADQNALFSEFSPFTRGEREAASLGPPSPAETRTQQQPEGCMENHAERPGLVKKKEGRTNKCPTS